MKTLRADMTLLPDGWASDVRVGIDETGRIAFVERPDGPDGADGCAQGRRGGPVGASGAEQRVGILLPAPTNAHSHAFQRAMAGLTERRGPDPTDSFWTWRRLMYRFLDRLGPDDIESITAFVQMEMLEAGYACSVEFHYLHHQVGGAPYGHVAELSERIVAAAGTSGIGLTLLPVHYRFGGCDGRALEGGQRRFGTDLDSFARLWEAAARTLGNACADSVIGVAPHSLRAVAPQSWPQLQALAPDAPFHLHLAEQVAEVEEVLAAWGARPVDWLLDRADVDARWCLIHCTQMLPRETARLAATGAVAGLCPITESNLGDGIFDGVAYLGAGGRIAVGSDSNVRISLAEELRTLDYSQRLRDRSRAALASAEHSTGRRLYEAVVAGGAQAAGRDAGAIEPGRWADLVVLDAEHVDLIGRRGDTLLDAFAFTGDRVMVTDVWAAGRHRVVAGRHVDRETIEQRYRAVMRTLAHDL